MGGQTEGQGSTGKCNAPHVGERPCTCLVRRAYDVEFVVSMIVVWQFGRRAPGSPRSGPARGGGWRAGTTPSGRPRGDAAGAREISRCRAPLHRSRTAAHRHAPDVELYSSTALSSSTALQRSTLYILYTLPQTFALQNDALVITRRAHVSSPSADDERARHSAGQVYTGRGTSSRGLHARSGPPSQ